jgi:hypothetical protein
MLYGFKHKVSICEMPGFWSSVEVQVTMLASFKDQDI